MARADVIVTPQSWLSKPRTKPIRFVEIHATRGSASPDAQFGATVAWMESANNRATNKDGSPANWGASCSYIIDRDGTLGIVLPDDRYPSHCAGYGGALSTYSIDEYGVAFEVCQSASQEPYTDEQYDRLARESARYVLAYDIPIVMLDIRRQSGDVPSGFVRHDRCENGYKLGKTDPGEQFDDARFLALVARYAGVIPEDEGSDMKVIRASDNGECAVLGALGRRWIDDGVELSVYLNACGQSEPISLSREQFDSIPPVALKA